MNFTEILDAIDKLNLDEQESLMEIICHRIIDKRRQQILADIEEAHRDYRAGRILPASADEIMDDILS